MLEKEKLVEIRKNLKMSQGTFAKTFGIPIGSLHNWEHGRNKMDAVTSAYMRTIEMFPMEVAASQYDLPKNKAMRQVRALWKKYNSDDTD